MRSENSNPTGEFLLTVPVNMRVTDEEQGVVKAADTGMRATLDLDKGEIRLYLNRLYELYQAVSLTFTLEEVILDAIVHETETALIRSYMYRWRNNNYILQMLHKRWRSHRNVRSH